MIAVVDYDSLLYRAGFAAQKTHRHVHLDDQVVSFESHASLKAWAEGEGYDLDELTVVTEQVLRPVYHATAILDSMHDDIWKDTGCTAAEFYLTGKDNFRYSIYPDYKANRKDMPKPLHLEALTQHAIDRHGAVVCNGYEADDMMAIRQRQLDELGCECVIVGIDKDLLTISGNHYNPVHNRFQSVTDDEALRYFYGQLLTGDSSDGIPGLYGVGKVKAAKILEECQTEWDMWKECLAQYYAASYTEEDCIRNARLLHMLRHEKDVWNPPTTDIGQET